MEDIQANWKWLTRCILATTTANAWLKKLLELLLELIRNDLICGIAPEPY